MGVGWGALYDSLCLMPYGCLCPIPQLFTEYGRLAMDEIFHKPFQVCPSFPAHLPGIRVGGN